MLIIRLKRIGKKNYPYYRMVVADKARAVNGKFIEILGSFNPHTKERSFKKERVLHWLSNGAQVSDTVYNLLVKENILQGESRKVRIVKKKKKKDQQEEQASAPQQVAEKEDEKIKKEEKQEVKKEPETNQKEEKKEIKEEKKPEAKEEGKKENSKD